MRILIPEDISDKGKEYLLANGYQLKIGGGTTEAELIENVQDVDGILVRNAVYSRRVLAAGPNLKVIGRHGTGVDNIDVLAAQELGIWVTNGPLANINAVAEHAMAFLLALAVNLGISDKRTRAGDWGYRNRMVRYELTGKRLGLIGFGRIGNEVAKKAIHGFGMEVGIFDPGLSLTSLPPGIRKMDSVEALLQWGDYISLHIPSTDKTRGMINHQLLKLMKKDACLINCARGDICVEEDLYEALKNGTIRGAALDVFSQEPLYESKLFELENVILTQHHGGITQDSLDRMGLAAAKGIHEVLSGEIPTWAVNCPENPPMKAKA